MVSAVEKNGAREGNEERRELWLFQQVWSEATQEKDFQQLRTKSHRRYVDDVRNVFSLISDSIKRT